MNLLEALPDELQELIKFYNPHPLAEMLKQDLELLTLDIMTEQSVIGKSNSDGRYRYTPMIVAAHMNGSFCDFMDDFMEIDDDNKVVRVTNQTAFDYRKDIWPKFKILRIPWRHVDLPEQYVAVTDDPDILAARELEREMFSDDEDDENYSWSDCPKIKKMVEQERYMCEYWMNQ